MAVQTQAPSGISSSTDRIERRYEFKASRSRIWRALTDAAEFSTWFRIKLEGPFIVGTISRGNMTNPGWEHVKQELHIVRMDPERFFSFRWHPYPVNRAVNYETDPTTLVEFTVEEIPGGSAITIVETGFDQLPPESRGEAFAMHSKGWDGQARNLGSMSRNQAATALQLPEAVPLFAALGDATRLRLLGRLSAGGPLSITRLSEGTGVTRQAVTRHLYALGDVGLVRHARRGRERVWDLNRERLDRAKRYLDLIAAQWDDAAERLRAFVEE